MKTISRKQAREAIQSKGLEGALHLGKTNLTAKQRRFAEGIVLEGLTGADAYRQAYDTSAKPKRVGNAASALKQHEGIKRELELLELHKQRAESYSIDSIKALIVSTLTDIAVNSDRDAVRVSAVKTLGVISGVDMFRETKRIETVKDSDDIKAQIMAQLKGMMLGSDDAVTVDATDLLAELAGDANQPGSDPTAPPPCQSDNGTPTHHEHSIPLEQSGDFSEDPPLPLDSSTPQGDIFLEKGNS
jgi:DnaJ-class molecular chaperone